MTKSSLLLLLLGFPAAVDAADSGSAKEPDASIIRVVTNSRVSGPMPPKVQPPIFAKKDSGSYECNQGEAFGSIAEYRAFEDNYRFVAATEASDFVPAKALNLPDPEPAESLLRPGYVSLLAAIGHDGKVANVLIECVNDSINYPYVLEAVKKATFDPAKTGGKPVASIRRIEYWIARF